MATTSNDRDDDIAIRDRLQALELDGKGRLTPEAVVEDARDPDSPLHDRFDWDTDRNAYQHLLTQARQLIRSVEIVFRNTRTTLTCPMFVRDPTAGAREQGYVTLKSVRKEEDLAREVVVAEFARASHILRRAQNIATALGLDGEIGALIDNIKELRTRVELREEARAS